MFILFQLSEISEKLQNDNLTSQELEVVRRKVPITTEYINTVNIGSGADWIVLLAKIASPTLAILVLGKKIYEGVEGWISLGKRIRSLFKRIDVISIDCDVATSLAITFINRRIKIKSIAKVSETTVNLTDLSCMIKGLHGLAKKPDKYYIQAYLINDRFYYIVGISSKGELDLLKHFKIADNR